MVAYGKYLTGGATKNPPPNFGYYVIEVKNGYVCVLPGADRSPDDGKPLVRNVTGEDGLYALDLGERPLGDVAPGQEVTYADAFHLRNRGTSALCLSGFSLSESLGAQYLAFYVKNDTGGDGDLDGEWVAAWLGNETFLPANGDQLSSTHYVHFRPGEEHPVKVVIKVPEATPGTTEPVVIWGGTGKIQLWFSRPG